MTWPRLARRPSRCSEIDSIVLSEEREKIEKRLCHAAAGKPGESANPKPRLSSLLLWPEEACIRIVPEIRESFRNVCHEEGIFFPHALDAAPSVIEQDGVEHVGNIEILDHPLLGFWQ